MNLTHLKALCERSVYLKDRYNFYKDDYEEATTPQTVLKLLSIIEIQGKALGFYMSQWRSDVYVGPTQELCEDSGKRAREALTAVDEMLGE